MRLLSRFGGPKTEPKWSQYRRKPSKIDIDIEGRFFIAVWSLGVSKMEAPNPTDPSETICFPASKRTPAISTSTRFGTGFGVHLAPFWHHFGEEGGQKSPKIAFETASQNTLFEIGFLIDFWSILVPKKGETSIAGIKKKGPKSVSAPRLGH